MNRKDYISDNLINIRDRLRQPRPMPDSTTGTPAAPENTASPAPPERMSTAAPPQTRAAVRREADGMRAQSDLLNRIAHDAAELAGEAELAEQTLHDSRALRDLLLALEEKTGQLSPEKDGANFARNVDNLRLEYFRIAGKRNAMRRAGGHVPRGEETGRGREWLLPAVILAGAMLLSAILVAIAMAAVFL